MNTKERASLAAKAKNIKYAKLRRDAYFLSPNICKNCGCPITPSKNQNVCEVNRKVFCNHKCSAEFNNKNRAKKEKATYSCACGNKVAKAGNKCKPCTYRYGSIYENDTKGLLIERRKYGVKKSSNIL